MFCQHENILSRIQEAEPKSDPFRHKSPSKTTSGGLADTVIHGSL